MKISFCSITRYKIADKVFINNSPCSVVYAICATNLFCFLLSTYHKNRSRTFHPSSLWQNFYQKNRCNVSVSPSYTTPVPTVLTVLYLLLLRFCLSSYISYIIRPPGVVPPQHMPPPQNRLHIILAIQSFIQKSLLPTVGNPYIDCCP